MAYRIEYGSAGRKSFKKICVRFLMIVTTCLLLFGFVSISFFPTGQDLLREVLFPGDDMVTQAAITNLMTDLREGASVTATFTTFCETIVDHALEQS